MDYYDDFTLNFSNPLCSSTPNFLHSSFLRSSTPNFLSSNPLHDLISYQSFDLSYIVHNSSVSNVDDNSNVSQENRFLTYVEDSVNHLTFSVSHSRLNKTNSRAYVDPCSPSPISTVSHSNVSQTNRCWNVSHRVLLNVSNSNDTSIQNPISTETRVNPYVHRPYCSCEICLHSIRLNADPSNINCHEIIGFSFVHDTAKQILSNQIQKHYRRLTYVTSQTHVRSSEPQTMTTVWNSHLLLGQPNTIIVCKKPVKFSYIPCPYNFAPSSMNEFQTNPSPFDVLPHTPSCKCSFTCKHSLRPTDLPNVP